jgi:hypothetical protein
MPEQELVILLRLRDEASAQLKEVNKALAVHEKSIREAGKAAAAYSTAALAMGGAITAALGLTVKAAVGVESVRGAFERLADTNKQSAAAILESLQTASAGTVSANNLMLAANRAMVLGVANNTEEFTTLMEIARDRSRTMGLSVTQAFDNIVTGIGRGSPLILDTLGLIINQTEANEQYAQSTGKVTSELTEEEKKIALLNAVLKQGREGIDRASLSTKTAGESIESFKVSIADASADIGSIFIPAVSDISNVLSGVIDTVAEWADENEELTKIIAGTTAAIGLSLVAWGAYVKLQASATVGTMYYTAALVSNEVAMIGNTLTTQGLTAAVIALTRASTTAKIALGGIAGITLVGLALGITKILGVFKNESKSVEELNTELMVATQYMSDLNKAGITTGVNYEFAAKWIKELNKQLGYLAGKDTAGEGITVLDVAKKDLADIDAKVAALEKHLRQLTWGTPYEEQEEGHPTGSKKETINELKEYLEEQKRARDKVAQLTQAEIEQTQAFKDNAQATADEVERIKKLTEEWYNFKVAIKGGAQMFKATGLDFEQVVQGIADQTGLSMGQVVDIITGVGVAQDEMATKWGVVAAEIYKTTGVVPSLQAIEDRVDAIAEAERILAEEVANAKRIMEVWAQIKDQLTPAYQAFEEFGLSVNQIIQGWAAVTGQTVDQIIAQMQGMDPSEIASNWEAMDIPLQKIKDLYADIADLEAQLGEGGGLEVDYSEEIAKIRELYGTYEEYSKSKSELAKEASQDAIDFLDAELKKAQDAYQTQLDYLDELYTKKTKDAQAETDAAVKALQAKIDALNEQEAANDQAAKAKEQQDKIAELRLKASTARSKTDREAAAKELADYLTEVEAERIKDELEAQKDALEDQIDAVEAAGKSKEEQLKAELQAEKDKAKSVLDIAEETHDKEVALAKDALDQKLIALDAERKAAEATAEATYQSAKDSARRRLVELKNELAQTLNINDQDVADKKTTEGEKLTAAQTELDAETVEAYKNSLAKASIADGYVKTLNIYNGTILSDFLRMLNDQLVAQLANYGYQLDGANAFVTNLNAELAKIERDIYIVTHYSSTGGGGSSGGGDTGGGSDGVPEGFTGTLDDWNDFIDNLDTGGLVSKPTLSWIAKNGKPEMVVPLSDREYAIKQVNEILKIVDATKVERATISAFAEGGIIDKPTMALIGEAGPEMIVPLNDHKAALESINEILRITGLPSFADGGIVGDPGVIEQRSERLPSISRSAEASVINNYHSNITVKVEGFMDSEIGTRKLARKLQEVMREEARRTTGRKP